MSLALEIIESIRSEMRRRGMRYSDLAKRLSLSEATLKRGFSKKQFSLKRIEHICNQLEINLNDLTVSGPENRGAEFFTIDQETLLAADDGLFAFLHLLRANYSVEDVEKEFTFGAKQIELMLLKLDRLKLIRLYAKNRFKLCVAPNLKWLPDGPLHEKYGAVLLEELVSGGFQGDHEFCWTTSGNATPAALATIRKKLAAALEGVQELLTLDASLPTESKTPLTLLMGLRSGLPRAVKKYKK